MEISNLKWACREHGKFLTDSELVSVAYTSSMASPSWSAWFDEVTSRLKACDLHKLTNAAVRVRADVIEGQVDFSFKIGYVTPERSAVDSFRDAIEVPSDFVVFLADKAK